MIRHNHAEDFSEEEAFNGTEHCNDMAAEVVISYSSKDRDKVMAFAQRLLDLNVNVWIDYGNIDGALLWGQEIVEAIEGCKVLVLMASESSMASHNVVKEVTLASENKKHILPLHLEAIAIPNSLKWHLAGIQHIELFRGNDESNFRAIVRSLERLGVKIETPTKTPPAPDNQTETIEKNGVNKQPVAYEPMPIFEKAESKARSSVTPPGPSPVHGQSAEAKPSTESNKRQTPERPVLSSPIESASAGTATTSDAVTTGQPAQTSLSKGKLAVTLQTPEATMQPAKQPAAVGGRSSPPWYAGFLGVLLVLALAGLFGAGPGASLVGFIMSLVRGLRPNESQKLVEDLRYYCGFGSMAIVLVICVVGFWKERGKKQQSRAEH